MLDTLKYAEALRAAGVTEKQAAAHAEALMEITQEGLATKNDLARLEEKMATKADFAEMKGEIARLETATKVEIAEVRGEVAELRGEVHGYRNESRIYFGILVAMIAALFVDRFFG